MGTGGKFKLRCDIPKPWQHEKSFYNGRFVFVDYSVGIVLGIVFGDISTVARNAMISYNINFMISYFMLIKMTFGFSFLKFLKSFIPDVCIAVMVCIAGFLTRYATIDATNIVGITINAVIKLAIMGGVYGNSD